MAVSNEPRMELLPDEWQALADLEVAARDAVGLGTWATSRAKLAAALAELDKVRGRRASVRDDEPRNRGIRSGMTDD